MNSRTPISKVLCRSIGIQAVVAIAAVGFASVSSAGGADALAAKLSSGDRAETDKARDAGRRPAEVVSFLGVKPGMTVIDVLAASGYYTEVLSVAVGDSGKVYAQNNDFILQMREGSNEKAISARLAGSRLKNVERLNREVADLGLAAGSVDFVFTALNFHDVYNRGGKEGTAAFLAAISEVLKPGGMLGIVDHDGNPGNDNNELHRMQMADAVAAVEAAGFVVDATSDLLRNADDDRSAFVFKEGMRGKTDRFVLRLRKK
jgi:predicted methyltransferase